MCEHAIAGGVAACVAPLFSHRPDIHQWLYHYTQLGVNKFHAYIPTLHAHEGVHYDAPHEVTVAQYLSLGLPHKLQCQAHIFYDTVPAFSYPAKIIKISLCGIKNTPKIRSAGSSKTICAHVRKA